ncbi:hypothetical protein [Geodermatophilus sp. SYSU D01176]
MTDPSTGPTPGAERSGGTPRWVKVLGALVLLLVLLVAVLHATGNGVGGPGDHLGLTAGAGASSNDGPAAAPR